MSQNFSKKEEDVKNKEFHNISKEEDLEIKQNEINAKLNETLTKQGEKIKTQKFADNTTKSGKALRLIIVCSIFLIIILGVYFALKFSGALEKLHNLEDIKNFILSGGNYSLIVFVVIQFLQVTFLPIPAFLTTVAGALIFGPWTTFILSFVSILIGSLFAFWLGRKFGKKILVWVAGKEDAEKWIRKLTNGKYAFFLMMLFPAFPDDILCIAAGVTNMSLKFFTVTNLITRPIGIFCICFVGSGQLIPYSGYYLILWAFILAFLISAFVFSIKKQAEIEKFVDKISSKLGGKKSHKCKKAKIENLALNDGENENNTNFENENEKNNN
ncbi:MAG: TVP38/TMEM64 family protein [Christensenellales bacterium]